MLVYDIIMENTDPNLVFIEMDTYWMTRGGQDQVDRYLRGYRLFLYVESGPLPVVKTKFSLG